MRNPKIRNFLKSCPIFMNLDRSLRLMELEKVQYVYCKKIKRQVYYTIMFNNKSHKHTAKGYKAQLLLVFAPKAS